MDFDKLFAGFSKIKVGVIGDVMLDTYWWGHVERISPGSACARCGTR
jgi:bifunctional ADP-heptose synthase (sugar kinase/adenylyltransferase)